MFFRKCPHKKMFATSVNMGVFLRPYSPILMMTGSTVFHLFASLLRLTLSKKFPYIGRHFGKQMSVKPHTF